MRCTYFKVQIRHYLKEGTVNSDVRGECIYLCFRAALLNVFLRLVSFQPGDKGFRVFRKLPKLLRDT